MTWRKKRQRLPHRDGGAAAAAAAAASEESMSLIIVGLAAGIFFYLPATLSPPMSINVNVSSTDDNSFCLVVTDHWIFLVIVVCGSHVYFIVEIVV